MSGLFNVSNTYDYMNSFFGSSSGSSSTGNVGGISTSLLSDLYAVQNGSYLKLAKKYYSQAETTDKATAAANDKTKELVKSSSEDAINSLSKLMDKNLFEKVKTTDEDGNTVYDYDREKILKTLETFVEDYNEVIENAGEMEGDDSLKAGVNMVNQVKVYKSALAQVGISVESDNTLKIDKEAFADADMTDMRSLFTGTVSFAKNLQTKLLQVYSSTSQELNPTNSLYSSQATKSISVGSMFDSIL